MITEGYDETDMMRIGMDSRLDQVYTALPATITSYNPSTQTCCANIVVQKPLWQDDGTLQYESYPTVMNVPVIFPRGGGYALTFPLSQGDGVMLLFSMQAFGGWRTSGQLDSPRDLRQHSLGAAAAIPGIFPKAKALHSASSSNMVLGQDSASSQIVIGSGIQLGSGATAAVAMAPAVNALILALEAFASSMAAASTGPLAALQACATALLQTLSAPTFPPPASTKVKAL